MKKLKNSHIVWIVIGSVVGGLLLMALFITTIAGIFIYEMDTWEQYVTTDLADYGKYIGNSSNESAKVFIDSFLPPQIEEDFSDVKYSYKAAEGDTYAFEIYLEFVIEDSSKYEKFVDSYTVSLEESVFEYAPQYTEYMHIDVFRPVVDEETRESKDKRINISRASIKKILCCDEEQRIIFIVMGVYDGGFANTEFLNVYFDKFNIDPLEYQRHDVNPNVEHHLYKDAF